MRDRLDIHTTLAELPGLIDRHTTLAELPGLIDRSVQMMMAQARDFLATFDLSRVPAEKIRARLVELEQQIRPAEEERLREAWLELHGGEPTIH